MKPRFPMKTLPYLCFALVLATPLMAETFSPLVGGKAPQTQEEMWAGWDPRKEPLNVEVLKEWEEEGVVMRVVRFDVGTFKGQPAKLAGIYGVLKGAKQVPGLLNIHGGGQYADHKAVLTNAKRGYATLPIAWAGGLSSPHYRVGPNEVKSFWEWRLPHGTLALFFRGF